MVDGIHGSPFSMSNVINLESEGSTTPRAASKDFYYVGKVFKYLKSEHGHRCLGQVIHNVVAYSSSIHDIVGNPPYGGAWGKRG